MENQARTYAFHRDCTSLNRFTPIVNPKILKQRIGYFVLVTKLARYWGVRLGEGEKYVDDGHRGNYIAIGWDELPNLSWILDENVNEDALWEKFTELYRKTYGGTNLQVSLNSGQVWNFVKAIKVGDAVLVPDPQNRKVLIGKVENSYEYSNNWKDGCHYPHRRKVRWIREIDRDVLSEKLKNSMGSLLTVFNIDHHAEETEELKGSKVEHVETEITGNKLVEVIINRLLKLSPRNFEEFTRDLLSIIGFEAANSQYVGDKGIDVTGSLNAEGLANIILRIQVKRITSTIGIEEVQRLRGTLSSDEHGAIVTTSKFTKQAQEEAQDEKKKRITLIDGEKLVDLILKYYNELDKKYKDLLKLQNKEVPLVDRFFTMA